MQMWSLAYPFRLHWKQFDSDWVIYEEASNQTMVLEAVEIDILMCLSAGSLDAGTLTKQVLDDLELEESSQNRFLVNACMSRLTSVGLIKQAQDASIPNQ